MSEDTKKKLTRREATAIIVASPLSGDTKQPWPSADRLSAEDLHRLTAYGTKGTDGQFIGIGNVRDRIRDAYSKQQSVRDILAQVKEQQKRIHPAVLNDLLVEILHTYEQTCSLNEFERNLIVRIVEAWPQNFQPLLTLPTTRIELVTALVRTSPTMEASLLKVLTEDERARYTVINR